MKSNSINYFEKNVTDISKVYGGYQQVVATGTASFNYNGSVVTGSEGVTIDDNGGTVTWVYANGRYYYGQVTN
jgi:hypothetical protein